MAKLEQTARATNIGVGILHPKQQNRFHVTFASPVLTEQQAFALSRQVVSLQELPEDPHTGVMAVRIVIEDDVANTVLNALKELVDTYNDELVITVNLVDGNETVLNSWLFCEAVLDQLNFGLLTYESGKKVQLTCDFIYGEWDLVVHEVLVNEKA